MTKYLSVGAAMIIIALGLLVWFQERRIVGLNKSVTQLEAVKAACEQQARIYQDWREIDRGTSEKIKKMAGADANRVAVFLNELFGQKPLPAAPGSARRPAPSRP
jgi:hypothetical protein